MAEYWERDAEEALRAIVAQRDATIKQLDARIRALERELWELRIRDDEPATTVIIPFNRLIA